MAVPDSFGQETRLFYRNDHRIGKLNTAAAVFHCFQGFPDVNAGHGAEGNLREDQLALGIAGSSGFFIFCTHRRFYLPFNAFSQRITPLEIFRTLALV